jgi:hypothetical protein
LSAPCVASRPFDRDHEISGTSEHSARQISALARTLCGWPHPHSPDGGVPDAEKGQKEQKSASSSLSTPRLQGTCHFGRYKNPRRPHPPPRASRVSHHPPQVSGLTLAHPCSPTLTRPRPPPSARPIDSGCAGPFLAPGQRGRNGLPRRCRFWVATHRMVD